MAIWRGVFLTVGVLGISALSLDAFDTASGSRDTLIANVFLADAVCAKGMVLVDRPSGSFCVDVYEASVGENCPLLDPQSAFDTSANVAASGCKPESVAGKLPWRFVTYHQAKQLCARAGKYLIDASMWYEAALGTPESACVLRNTVQKTGQAKDCVAGSGAFDMVGNVWEVVDTKASEVMASEGYVVEVDSRGLPQEASSTPSAIYSEDYVWVGDGSSPSLLRGGFYGANSDGGLYATHAGTLDDFSSAAIGFRCASTI